MGTSVRSTRLALAAAKSLASRSLASLAAAASSSRRACSSIAALASASLFSRASRSLSSFAFAFSASLSSFALAWASLSSRAFSALLGSRVRTSDDVGVELKGVRSGVERRRGVSGLKAARCGRRDTLGKESP